MGKDDVGVEVQTSIVLLEDLRQDGGLLPGVAAVCIPANLDEIVLISVDFGCEKNQELDTSGGLSQDCVP